MNLGRYRLLKQIGAGVDGVLYLAEDREDGATTEVALLSSARSNPIRWREIARRLTLAGMVAHPSRRRFEVLEPEGETPRVVLERIQGPTLMDVFRDESEVVPRALELAEALAAGHRLGLSLGMADLGTLRVRELEPYGLVLDWLGLDLGSADRLADRADRDQPPEFARNLEPTAASDIFRLGSILRDRLGTLAMAGSIAPACLARLVAEMTEDDPAARPSIRVVATQLKAATREVPVGVSGYASDTSVTTVFEPGSRPIEEHGPLDRDQLGRFRLIELLGKGGMGTVYRGKDLADGSEVAVKVLHQGFAGRPDALRRFHKEARLLAEVSNPRVANFLELNEDEGIHYLVLEYVEGRDLAGWMTGRGPVDEKSALAIVVDVARALESAHERGIVHRDIKPENILLTLDSICGEGTGPPRAKLSDFGLARHVVESESLVLTRDGAILGTPLYMSPEQCAGEREIGPPADVYSLGATLFSLLAGRPPFEGESSLVVMAQHRAEPVPDLKALVPWVSDAAASIVARAMAKRPEHRYADAREMLVDLERLTRGEPTGLEMHPRLPSGDHRDVVRYDWRWELEANPRSLWPVVSNTERFNRAIGLSAATFDDQADPEGGSRKTGRMRRAGLEFAWREHPFEWVEGRRMGVVREFERGPFEWFVSVVELTPSASGGTTLTHQLKIKPRGLLGRTIAAVEVGTKGRKSIDRVYRRIDATLTGKLGRDPVLDPYEAPEPLSGERRRRLERWLDALGTRGFNSLVVERIGDYLELAPAQEVARIRPLALARRLGLSPDAVVEACLRGAADGVLILLWDILCPICRIPSQVMDTLRTLKDHGHCESCRLDFELDFANSVELIFRVHPEIRETDVATYCAGSPSHSPHVAAQARVAPGERIVLDMALEVGSYRLRGPQLPYAVDFRIESGATARRWDLDLGRGADADLPRSLCPGGQSLSLANGHDREVLVRVERLVPREDALTAARASSLALFRELFPGEILSPGRLIGLDTVTLVVTELDRAGELYASLGDAGAFAIILDHFRRIETRIKGEGGALIKTVHEGTVSVFSDPASAVRAALGLARLADVGPIPGPRLRVGVHRGGAMVATLNDHLDYFGTTVSVATRLPALASPGEVVLTRSVVADPRVAALLAGLGLLPLVREAAVEGLADPFIHRVGPGELGPSET